LRDRVGWTCLHHALSLKDPSPSAAAWIATALTLPSGAMLLETALQDLADAVEVEVGMLEHFRGNEDALQVIVVM
jgi:hypothetical protein